MSGQFEAFAKKRKTEDVFTVYINECEKKQIRDWVKMKPDIETGGDLFGLWIDAHTAVVQFVLGPGDKCRRTTVSFFQDVDYLQQAGDTLTKHHGLCNIGQWHSHHKLALSEPSAGDHSTVWNNMPTLGLERYIVFIANITRSRQVTVNCFLFEMKDGQQLPVMKGCLKEVSGESPLRLNKQLQERINIGAESVNTRDELKPITVQKNSAENEESVVTSNNGSKKDFPTENSQCNTIATNIIALAKATLTAVGRPTDEISCPQNEPKEEDERIPAGNGQSVTSNNGSENDFLKESSQGSTIAANTKTSAKPLAKPTITPVESPTGHKNGDNQSGKKDQNTGERIPLAMIRNDNGYLVFETRSSNSSAEQQAQEQQQQQAASPRQAAAPPQKQEQQPQEKLDHHNHHNHQMQIPQPPKYKNKEQKQNQTDTEASKDSTITKQPMSTNATAQNKRGSRYDNLNPATDSTPREIIESTFELPDGHPVVSKDNENTGAPVQETSGPTTSDSHWSRLICRSCFS